VKEMKNRVVMTGMGAVSPIGSEIKIITENLKKGTCGIKQATQFDVEATGITCAGEVNDFDPTTHINKREARRLDRFTQMGMVAALKAWEHSQITESDYDAMRVGVILGSGMGGLNTVREQQDVLKKDGPRAVSPLFVPKSIINIAAGLIAIRLGLHGPCYGIVTACSSGTDAIGHAYMAVKEGRLDAVLVGGAESVLNELAVQGFHQMQALSESKDPSRASIPFDEARQGFVMAEGAAFILIENEASALKRHATVYGEIAGYGQTCDAHHMTAPFSEGTYAAEAMCIAVKEAGLSLEDVDYINAHGTGTPLNDKTETTAVIKAFGEHAKSLIISSTKSMTGHMLGGAGAMEAIISAIAINESFAPPTIGLQNEGEGCTLDYTKGKKRDAEINVVISNSFGFGGHNSSLLIKKYR
jgi:3-oxoacyl-[acyl-carrier-protein] synthase II